MTTSFPAMPLRPRICTPEVQPSMAVVPGYIHVAVTVDDGGNPRLVTEEDLDNWGATLPELVEIARQRLLAESHSGDWSEVDTVPGMVMLAGGDGQASNRMLVIQRMITDWPIGGVAIVVPGEDQLLAVPLHDVAMLDALNVMVTAAHYAHATNEQPLSDQAFWTNGSEWHAIAIEHTDDEVNIEPPDELLDALGRLANIGMVATAGEA